MAEYKYLSREALDGKMTQGTTLNWGDDNNDVLQDVMKKSLSKESGTTQTVTANVAFNGGITGTAVSATGGNNKIVKTDASGNIGLSGNITSENIITCTIPIVGRTSNSVSLKLTPKMTGSIQLCLSFSNDRKEFINLNLVKGTDDNTYAPAQISSSKNLSNFALSRDGSLIWLDFDTVDTEGFSLFVSGVGKFGSKTPISVGTKEGTTYHRPIMDTQIIGNLALTGGLTAGGKTLVDVSDANAFEVKDGASNVALNVDSANLQCTTAGNDIFYKRMGAFNTSPANVILGVGTFIVTAVHNSNAGASLWLVVIPGRGSSGAVSQLINGGDTLTPVSYVTGEVTITCDATKNCSAQRVGSGY